MNRSVLLILCASVLAACEAPPRSSPTSPASVPDAPTPVPSEPQATPASLPAPSGPVTPAAQQQAQKVSLSAVEMLESGNEDQAKNELRRALAIDPQNKLALSLQKQIQADPVATLGRESFPYTVRPSDTMSRISQRYLGDVYAFYILSRYNDIKIPKQVASGQVIRIPGKPRPESTTANQAPSPTQPAAEPLPRPSPQPSPPPAPSPVAAAPAPLPAPEATPGERAMKNAVTAERAGDFARARSEYLTAASNSQPGATASAERMRIALVQRYSTNARGALARQDLDGSISNWQKVLELDPENGNARLELERARGLKEKLQNVK